MQKLHINGKSYKIDKSGDSSLLWTLRDDIAITSLKYGCGKGICGSCTILVDGKVQKSCQLVLSDIVGKKLTTIEGIKNSHPIKQVWKKLEVPQCGYCQSGQMLHAISLLNERPRPTDAQIREHMDAVLCRCGTYYRIIEGIKQASKMLHKEAKHA
jgi:isoquinoline 1-oxidoreductase subunit alpha